jgi:hypothetical protein
MLVPQAMAYALRAGLPPELREKAGQVWSCSIRTVEAAPTPATLGAAAG